MVWVCTGWIAADGAFCYHEQELPERAGFVQQVRLILCCPKAICWAETEATRAAVSACAKSGPG